MPWYEGSVMDEKNEFILLWKTGKFTVTSLAILFGISRTTAYKYINRYLEIGQPGLEEQPRRPHNIPRKTPDHIEDAIIKLRGKHPRWGAPKLLVLLEADYPNTDLPRPSTINQILRRNGLFPERRQRRKVEPQKPIFDPKAPNEVWSADFKGKFRMGNKEYCHPLTVADSYSRYVFTAKGLLSPNMKNTKPVFINIFRRYGLPQQLHTDNGAPFGNIHSLGRLTKLGVWLMELGIQPVFSDPAHPEQNGRHERMHRELKAEATKPPGVNLQTQQRKLNSFVREYNELRPHEALDMRTPAAVHVKSEREYNARIPEWYYPNEYKVRYICRNGSIRIGKANWLFVTTALIEKNIGLEEMGNGIYRIYFRQFFLGYLDEKNMKVYDIMDYNYSLHV